MEKEILFNERLEVKSDMGRLLGVLLAQVEIAQADAVPSVNWPGGRKITERYYQLCLSNPAKAYPELLQSAKIWTEKRDYGIGVSIKKTLRLLDNYEQEWPKKLTAQEKCLFAQGYAIEIQKLRENRKKRIKDAITKREKKRTVRWFGK